MTALLVPYAGSEAPAETARQSAQERRLRQHWGHAKRAYVMFKAGRDTHEISLAIGFPERLVSRWITDMREQLGKLPDSYRGKRGRIA